jgi:PAS domain S-box-containing protein
VLIFITYRVNPIEKAYAFSAMGFWMTERPGHKNLKKKCGENHPPDPALRPADESFSATLSGKEALLSAVPDIILQIDASDNICTWANRAGLDFFGDDLIGKKTGFYKGPDQEDTGSVEEGGGESDDVAYSRTWMRRRDGRMRLLSWRTRTIKDQQGKITGAVSLGRDVTEMKKSEEKRAELEAEVQHQRRLEMLGTLAGGVAHDFNNILTGISGFTYLALEQLSADSPAREDLNEVLELSRRAEELTRKLLIFSRREKPQMKEVDVNQLIGDLLKMLKRLIPENIDVVFSPGIEVGAVRADQAQIEEVLINLAVNARDAMPTGGMLVIETSNTKLNEDYVSVHRGSKPGPHVMIAVSDTGFGMDREILEHLFEPFFSTKKPGMGTGLGLATVYGIVKQHRGNIWAYSEPGRGSAFKVYLPRIIEMEAENVEGELKETVAGRGTILVVEDEASILRIAKRSLEAKGYRVFTADSPSEAERVLASSGTDIDLLLSDVVLPEMNGGDLYKSVRRKYPHIRALFMSGYTDDVIVRKGMLDSKLPFIQKPFTQDALGSRVKEVLEGGPNGK